MIVVSLKHLTKAQKDRQVVIVAGRTRGSCVFWFFAEARC
jgi:hypothetical protein